MRRHVTRYEYKSVTVAGRLPVTMTADSNQVGAAPDEEGQTGSAQTGGGTVVTQGGEEKGACLSCCAPEKTVRGAVIKLGVCFLAGIVFGWALEKGRVFEPEVIRAQMVFERWIMIKMFLAAMAVGQLVLALLSLLPWTLVPFTFASYNFTNSLDDKSVLTSCVGAFLLGVGMTLAGACPGMVLAQVGSWTKNSLYTFLGALMGALLYGFVGPVIVRLTKPVKAYDFPNVYEKAGIFYWMLAVPCALLLLASVLVLEWFVPWQSDLPVDSRNSNATMNQYVIFWKAWPPSVSGGLIGLLQLVIVLAVGDTLGGSSSYMTLASQWVIPSKLQATFPHLAKFRCGLGNWWQVVYVFGAMVGGCMSALSSGSLATTRGVDMVMAFSGGFLMLFGARFASGCTSGHGLSGVALFYWLSLVAIPAMFGGAISTAYTMKYMGILDQYDCYGSCTPANTTISF